jgi:hypothetical protein
MASDRALVLKLAAALIAVEGPALSVTATSAEGLAPSDTQSIG